MNGMRLSRSETPVWCVAQVLAGAEIGVGRRLTEEGHTAFIPMAEFKVARGAARHTKRRALFAGYLLLRAAPVRLSSVLETPGVMGVLGAYSPATGVLEPAEISAATVDRLSLLCPMSSQTLKAWLGAGRPHSGPEMIVGEPVRIGDGVFAGLDGIVARVDSGFRVSLDVTASGNTTRIVIDRRLIKAGPAAVPRNVLVQ